MEARAAGEGNRGRERIEERERRNAGKGEEGKGVGLLESPKPLLGVPVSENGETGVGNAGFEFF